MSQQPSLDREDARVRSDDGIGGLWRSTVDRFKSGDMGPLAVILGLIVIATVFSLLNPVFLRPANLTNLLFDASAVGLIALGVVLCLLLGEIDLSIGSMSGAASAIFGTLWITLGLPWPVAVAAAVCAGALTGLVYAFLLNRFGMPSFISTLSGLLALLGLQLYLLGNTGSINLPFDSFLIRFGQTMVLPDWLSYALAPVPGIVMLLGGLKNRRDRKAANLSSTSMTLILLQAGSMTAILFGAAWYLNLGRGVPAMFILFVAIITLVQYLLVRTQWGRMVFAVGGNREAARRAGINVERIRISAFMLCSTLAAMGGVLAATRLASASRQAGTGDVNLNAIAAAVIGGASLFGGRGSAWAALLGVLVITAISNGLTLLNLSSSLRYMITGGVLALAVIIDSLARRSKQNR